MTRQLKTWIVIPISAVLVFVLSASVTAAVVVSPDPPQPPTLPLSASRAAGAASPSTGLDPRPSEPATRDRGQGTSVSGAASVTARVQPVRLLVLDDRGRISQIWSNTGAGDVEPMLAVRLRSVDGPLLAAVPGEVLDEYGLLLDSVDWSVLGLTYEAE